jgi:predicted amidohydrolase YtcJ
MCFSHGIAGWQDAIVGASSVGPDHLDAYLAASSDGSLKARASLALWWDRDRGLEQLDELVARRALVARSPGQLRAGSIKIMVDGVAENYSAAVSGSYLDHHGHPTGGLGLTHFTSEQLIRIVRELDRNGFQAHFHALGDRAVTYALDAVENALRANGQLGNRHHLAHLQMIRIEDVPRFAELDATATIQALWAQPEPQMCELTLPFLDPGLRSRQYPFGDLLAAGARLAGGSDWPVSTAYPLEAMQIAVTRLDPENPAAPALLPEQAIPLERIWTAYTAGSAWVCHRESEAGSLDPGKLADLAILDRNPFEIDPMELSGVRVLSTVVGGEEVHTA